MMAGVAAAGAEALARRSARRYTPLSSGLMPAPLKARRSLACRTHAGNAMRIWTPSIMHTPQSSTGGAGSGAADERAQAYAELETTEDVALAVASVAPLTAVCARPVEEVDAAELQRAGLAGAHLVSRRRVSETSSGPLTGGSVVGMPPSSDGSGVESTTRIRANVR